MYPENWKKKSLSDVAEIQTGIAKGQKNLKEPVELPYLRVANVQDGFLNLSEIKTIMVEKSQIDRYLLQTGDVLLTEGGDFDKLGRGTVWQGEINQCVHQNHIFVARPKREHILPEFLSLLTGSNYGKNYFLKCSKQSTNLASINSKQLKEFPVVLPSLFEQYAIVNVLLSWDATISMLERLINAKEKNFSGLLKVLIDNRNPEEKWQEVKLGVVADKVKGQLVELNDEKRGLPYIGSVNFDGYYTVYTDDKKAVFCEPKDILLLCDGEYAGKTTTGLRGAVSSTVLKLSLSSEVNNHFVRYHLLKNINQIRAIREGSGVPHIPGDFFEWYTLSFPSLTEQQRIAETLNTARREIDLLKNRPRLIGNKSAG